MLPLVLGGHSFIKQLGNDPMPSPAEADALVRRCLEMGIAWFDTTYLPERVMLGACLKRLQATAQARIIAWNFFHDFAPGEDVGGPLAWQSHHLERVLNELGVERLHGLVVHLMGDADVDRQQVRLARDWHAAGLVAELGIWAPGENATSIWGKDNPFHFVVQPHNITTPGSLEKMAAYKALGWRTLACSPFVRGYELDTLVSAWVRIGGPVASEARIALADLLLRFSMFSPGVDQVIISMRKHAYVDQASVSLARGRLSQAEEALLVRLRGMSAQ